MTITCQIIFENNPYRVFYSGQNVIGHIELKISEATKIKGISYIFSGKGQCKFSVKHGKRTTLYTGNEPYFEKTNYLVSNGQDEQTLAAGTYTYPFSEELPYGFPSSIESPNNRSCHVRYSIKVVVEKPFWFSTKFEEYFTHVKPLDLNVFPLFRGPIAKNDSNTYYWGGFCLPIESKPITVSVLLPSTGYAPGQSINVTVDVDNRSNVNAVFDVNLVQHFDLKITQPTLFGESIEEKEKWFTIVQQPSVYTSRAGSKNEFETSLRIPPLPPTDQESSKTIRVRYYVSVVRRAGVLHKDVEITMPILIGTCPFVKRNIIDDDRSVPHSKDDSPNYEVVANNKIDFRPAYPVFRCTVVADD